MSRNQLKYVVPGYVWQQARFKIDWEAARPIIENDSGIVVVESMSIPRREYAAASFLSLILRQDYHADVGWTSFYPLSVSEFTDAYRLPRRKPYQAIALKTELTPGQEEQVQDFAVSCKIAVIAAPPGFKLFAPHALVKLSARELRSKDYQSDTSPTVI